MRIGDLARRCDVSTDTLRFYERQGLIQADRRPNGYRDFPEETAALVGLIRLAQSLGFSLSEISALLRDMQGGLAEDEVESLLRGKLADIDRRILAMRELRKVVADRLEAVCPLGLDGKAGRQVPQTRRV